jgi:hypothetical protein
MAALEIIALIVVFTLAVLGYFMISRALPSWRTYRRDVRQRGKTYAIAQRRAAEERIYTEAHDRPIPPERSTVLRDPDAPIGRQ